MSGLVQTAKYNREPTASLNGAVIFSPSAASCWFACSGVFLGLHPELHQLVRRVLRLS